MYLLFFFFSKEEEKNKSNRISIDQCSISIVDCVMRRGIGIGGINQQLLEKVSTSIDRERESFLDGFFLEKI